MSWLDMFKRKPQKPAVDHPLREGMKRYKPLGGVTFQGNDEANEEGPAPLEIFRNGKWEEM